MCLPDICVIKCTCKLCRWNKFVARYICHYSCSRGWSCCCCRFSEFSLNFFYAFVLLSHINTHANRIKWFFSLPASSCYACNISAQFFVLQNENIRTTRLKSDVCAVDIWCYHLTHIFCNSFLLALVDFVFRSTTSATHSHTHSGCSLIMWMIDSLLTHSGVCECVYMRDCSFNNSNVRLI